MLMRSIYKRQLGWEFHGMERSHLVSKAIRVSGGKMALDVGMV